MSESLFDCRLANSLDRRLAKRPARGSQNQPFDFVQTLAAQTLVQCVMLAVYWQKLCSCIAGGSCHQLAGHRQRFLVTKTTAAAHRESVVGGKKANGAHGSRNYRINSVKTGYRGEPFRAGHYLGAYIDAAFSPSVGQGLDIRLSRN